MIEDKLRAKLLANTQLAALVGDRIFVLQAPQGVETPYVVYSIISNNPVYTIGCVNDKPVIQYSVFSQHYSQARTIQNLIRSEIDNYHGTLDGVSVASIQCNGLGINEREKDSQLVHISYDYQIHLN